MDIIILIIIFIFAVIIIIVVVVVVVIPTITLIIIVSAIILDVFFNQCNRLHLANHSLQQHGARIGIHLFL
jgi:hypothetical protein